MIMVADSGSTKTSWRLADSRYPQDIRTKGLNPYFLMPQEMINELRQNEQLLAVAQQVEAVYFYGAGLSDAGKITEVKETLQRFFSQAKHILVASDMLGAARAVLQTQPGIACILGTGSNSCVFNGEQITENIPALGYVLGDEGSGADLGKRFLQAYFYEEIPPEIRLAFQQYIKLTDSEIFKAVYQKPLPNRFLASIAPFIHSHKQHFIVKNMVKKAFSAFVEKHILPYQLPLPKIGFCGSIAYYFQDELQAVLQHYHLTVDTIVQNPIDKLVEYHTKKPDKNTGLTSSSEDGS